MNYDDAALESSTCFQFVCNVEQGYMIQDVGTFYVKGNKFPKIIQNQIISTKVNLFTIQIIIILFNNINYFYITFCIFVYNMCHLFSIYQELYVRCFSLAMYQLIPTYSNQSMSCNVLKYIIVYTFYIYIYSPRIIRPTLSNAIIRCTPAYVK